MGDEYTINERQQDYYQQIFYLQKSIEEDSHISTLLELKEFLDDISLEISEKVKTLKPDDNENQKYTLKQLRQAWAAGRLSATKGD